MKKQLKLLFFVAMLVTLVVMTMVFASASGEYQLTKSDSTTATYDTLQAAVDAAEDTGSTITVTAPVTAASTNIAGKTLTINGGNNLITVSKGTTWLTVGLNANVTLQGMNLTYTGATDDETEIITVNGADATLTVSGKNTFLINANGGEGVANAATTNLICVNNDSAVVNVIGGEKGENTDDRVVIYQVGNGIGLEVIKGFLHVKNVFMTDTHGGNTANHTAFVKATGGEAFVEDSEFLAERVSNKNYSLVVAAGGLLNIKDCVVTDYYAIEASGASAVINVMGDKTKVKSNSAGTAGGALTFVTDGSGTINVFGGTFSGNQPVYYKKAGTLNVYGGRFVNDTGKGFAFYLGVANAKFNVMDKDVDTYTVKVNGENYQTFTAQGAELRSCANWMFHNNGKGVTIYLGNGTEIYLEAGCSFDGRLSGYTSVTVGTIDYYCLDTMYDSGEVGQANVNSTKLPAIEHAKWANTTFHILPPASLDMTTGIIEINSKNDLLAKADKAQDTTMTTWGGSYKGFEYVEGAIPGFILKNGTTVTLKDNNETYEDLLTLFTVEEGATLIIEGNIFKAAASTSGFTPIIQVNGGRLTITGENTRFIAEDWTFNSASDHKGLIHATAGSTITIDCVGTHTPITDNNLENINNVQANFVASKNGYLIALDGDGITVTVNGGVFLRKSGEVIPGNANHTTFSTGSVFGIWGDLTEDSTSKITINGGYFYSHSMVRIFASAQKSETVGETTVTTPLTGWTVEISGGTFVTNSTGGTEEYPNGGTSTANNNAFQINAPGKHTITFTKGVNDSKPMVYGNKDSGALIRVNVGEKAGYLESGCSINVLAGEFNIVKSFFNVPNYYGNVSLTVKNAVITQDAKSNSTVISLANTTGLSASSLTLQNVQIYAGDTATIIKAIGNVKVEIVGGVYAGGALMGVAGDLADNDGNDQTTIETPQTAITSFTVKGGTIILMGDNANWYFYDVEITDDVYPIIVAKANTLIKEGVTLGEYSPVVKYGTLELKAWMSFAADESGYAPELVPGAGLYLGENGNSVTDVGCGIRFKSTISKSIYDEQPVPDALAARDYYLVSFGTLIAPADYVAAAGAFTVNALETLSNKLSTEDKTVTTYITVDAYHVENRATEEEWGCVDNGDGTLSFAVALINLRNDERSYAAVPYVCYTDGEGNFEYIYGAFNSVDNARSATQIEALLNQ